MSHNALIIDSDAHFTIDAITRQIKNTASTKVTVIQYDHNSERFTFSLPRFIEGHDMLEVDKAEVHYINVGSGGAGQKAGIYEITDLKIDDKGENKVNGSWLLSQNATSLPGSLNFMLRFSCFDDEGNLEYVWNTAVFSGISVSTGMYNSEIIVEKYADVLEQWRISIVDDAKVYIEGEKKIEFDRLYENVTEYQVPENTGIKSAKVVWLDNPDLTDNAYFEFYDSSGTRIGDSVNVYRSDGLEQEVFFNELKTVPVAKVKLLTDVANATVTSITYYNNLAITAANDYTDNAIQQAILDSWGDAV